MYHKRLHAAKECRQQAAVGAFGTNSTLHNIALTPNDNEINKNLESAVQDLNYHGRPENSSKALEPKKEEWLQYCDKIFPHDPYQYLVTSNKAYRFMCYQMFRESKPRGGKRIQLKDSIYFDIEDYNKVMKQFYSKDQAGGVSTWPKPSNPVGYSVWMQYKVALKEIFKEQQSTYQASITNAWEHVWTSNFDKIRDHVKTRKQKIKKENYMEKIDGEFAPYAIVEHYGAIEDKLYSNTINSIGERSICASLRHRFCFLYLTSGILRGESVYQADLSDFQGITMAANAGDLHPLYIMIMQIPFGKTNRGYVRYGRATRHRDVRLCCIGSLSFYLNFRFFSTKEFEKFTTDTWCNNRAWFDIKLLVDIHTKDNTTVLKKDSYSKKLREILKELGLSYNKLVHLGRKLGAHMLDFLEEFKEDKQLMGQWSPDVVDNHYSSKLPMRPIRKLAGYTTQQALYYNPRSMVEPKESLLRQTPMGSWCIDAYNGMQEIVRNAISNTYQTAVHVLKFFCYINKVFVQDSAAMLLLHPSRMEDSPLFKSLPVFKSSLFSQYLDEMGTALRTAQDPLESRIDAVVPGLLKWHKNHQENFTKIHLEMDTLKKDLGSRIEDLSNDVRLERLKQAHRVSQGLQNLSSTFTDSFETELREFEAKNCIQLGGNDSEQQDRKKAKVVDEIEQAIFHAEKTMIVKHKSLKSVWEEWYGFGEHKDVYGGIQGRENRFGSKWRRNLVHSQHFSRVKRVITGIEAYAKTQSVHESVAVETLETTFEKLNFSLYNFFCFLQEEGYIVKCARRGKSKHE